MRHDYKLRTFPAKFLLPVLAVILVHSPFARAGDEVVVVVNKSNTVADMNLDAVRKVFTGDKNAWPNGRKVTVFMSAPGSAEREAALRTIYKMSSSDYTKYFMQATFTGRVQAPPREVNAAEVRAMVADNPGAIGCIRKDQADDTVKVVLTLP
jgi:ABC-type phosphate transport system substrate-binding protein